MSTEPNVDPDLSNYDPAEGDPGASGIVFWGVVGTALLVVIVIFLEAFFYSYERGELDRKSIQGVPRALRELNAEQATLMSTYGVVDKDEKIVRIPVDKAIDKYLKENR